MEDTKKNDTEEIFEESETTEVLKIEPHFNLENPKFHTSSDVSGEQQSQLNEEQTKKLGNLNCKQNNNHHVVPVGLIIVLITIYLGMASVQKCLVSCVENKHSTELVHEEKEKFLKFAKVSENLKLEILDKLLEHRDICKDIDIFKKDKATIECEKEEYKIDYEANKINAVLDNENNSQTDKSVENSSGSGSGSGHCSSPNFIESRSKKSKYSIKTTNSKNGFNKYNKSTKAKYQKNHSNKELNLNKKSSTSEPIIYLFALVFIYLLLKAASDINQHYKTQNKNDKRLRRCSLQSYAQNHRPDRRASKALTSTALALKEKQHPLQQRYRLKLLSRSFSQDQQYLMDSSNQITEQQNVAISTAGIPPTRFKVSYSNNWQLIRQHTTTQSLDNSDINCARGNAETHSTMMTRRCSVPAVLGYQRQKSSYTSPLSTVSGNVNANNSLSRRTSITPPIPLSMDPNEGLVPEIKRRVRMINRH